jgi:CheY-like chemotaxis protein
VELHGGSIEARSDGEGRGATFIARLPARFGEVPAPEAPLSSAVAGHAQKELRDVTLLIVEDEFDARKMLVTLFESCGARVLEASSGAEAIARLKRTRPDVIVSDIGLRGEDGITLLRELRQNHGAAAIPALALTAYARPQERAAGFAAGFDAYVAKPIDFQKLLEAISEVLSHPSSRAHSDRDEGGRQEQGKTWRS